MIKKTAGLMLWVFLFQLVLYFVHQYASFDMSAWFAFSDVSPIHPPQFVIPMIWSTLYVMITIAGWLLWQERRRHHAKTALLYYFIVMVMSWAWTPIFFKLHWVGVAFFWTLGTLAITLYTIIYTAEKFEYAAILLTPYLLWLFYLSYLCIDFWLKLPA